ncbi:hypothetical protein CBS63078_3986 [Aspergillus niger]|uniref:Contig An16c0060, genomic contig n=2 Tax=Aspergillus niger TaxID=5061 RepID=A2R6V9_ASPNC|nr:uncharacterized protein An16g01380 [Aspergillus niger]KAI2818211.1 hypothetical protein CBS115989_5325 [Aspergillus niger]KAI2826172.1 hypothetical protein CBS133816_7698 [Aspergillus niger]KAI2842556.1 hypothetical protein CBS11350_5822 [Aspergillus niger]KAI2854231.1 hypothetical protein CBS11232_5080 [Aspergillus niger]KAI2863635.1 hypothetical protein CBS12448_3670 [Aspergillus niger]|eukprot:XP_001397451.1 hypothetical protein ANI_1_1460144 [Aspergillus niger CBS 513.88]
MSATEHLDVANLAVYALFSLPAIYCLVVHGKHGLLGWAYVLVMCGLRIAGSAMSLNAIHRNEINTTAAILNGIGLSPLLMAAMGLLHEANHSIHRFLPPFLNLWGFLITHMVVAGGIGLAAASSGNETLLRVGMIVFATGWTLVAVLIWFSYGANAHSRRLGEERQLLFAITVAMPLIGVRIVYAIVTAFTSSNLEGGSLAVRVIFGTIPEYLVMLIYVGVGIVTRNLVRSRVEYIQPMNQSQVPI